MDAEYNWNGCNKESKILQVVWSKSVITMIFRNAKYTGSLIDAISNGDKFSFCGHDVHSMVYSFDD